MLKKDNTSYKPLNPVIDRIYGNNLVPIGAGYRRFSTKEAARLYVLEAIAPYKPKFSDYLAELRSHSKVNQYVWGISDMNKAKPVNQESVDEAYRRTMQKISANSEWIINSYKSDAQKQREAIESGQIDKIINCDSVSTYVPQPKEAKNG